MYLAGVASGDGRVLRHLDRRSPAGANVGVVVSDRTDASILEWAASRDIATAVMPSAEDPNAGPHPLADQLADQPVDLVCLDGYEGPLTDADLERLPPTVDRHDALLPAFPGPDPIEAALTAGVSLTGCTVTVVTSADEHAPGSDHGRIVTQEPVPVTSGDADALAERLVHRGAFRAYPRAVRQLSQERVGSGSESNGDDSTGRADDRFEDWRVSSADRVAQLRYGENPHQDAAIYMDPAATEPTVIGAAQLNPDAKALSYNNYADADAALALVREFERPAAAVIKHTNPTGCAVADTVADAYRRALRTDEMSAFGGIVALNRRCDRATAERVAESYKEVVVAPGYTDPAVEVLGRQEGLRVLDVGDLRMEAEPSGGVIEQSIAGGRLVQERDQQRVAAEDLEIVTDRTPSSAVRDTMVFAWPVVKHVKSNAIVLATGTETVGVGMGQVSRIDAVRLAVRKAREHAVGKGPDGAVMASDAFFPFPDAVEAAAEAGIQAVVQPGGSVNDDAVIEACEDRGLAMGFTGRRAFRHG